jgi:putative transposase
LPRQRGHGGVLLEGEDALADRFTSCGEAKMELFDYIEVFYNQRRCHSTIGLVSPAAFERAARVA